MDGEVWFVSIKLNFEPSISLNQSLCFLFVHHDHPNLLIIKCIYILNIKILKTTNSFYWMELNHSQSQCFRNTIKGWFTRTGKFRLYLLTLMLMEGQVKFFNPMFKKFIVEE